MADLLKARVKAILKQVDVISQLCSRTKELCKWHDHSGGKIVGESDDAEFS